MKKIMTIATIAVASFGFTGCGPTGQTFLNDLLNNVNTGIQDSGETSTLANTLTSVLGVVATASPVAAKDLPGSWNYTSSKIYFESENVLAQLGGQAAATTIESNINTQLAKLGIKKGACSFQFAQNGTFQAVIGGKNISGTYKLNEQAGTLTLTTALGLGNITCNVTRNGTQALNLLFPADKLLQMAQLIGTVTGNSSLSSLSSLLGNYNGMQVGLQLHKQS